MPSIQQKNSRHYLALWSIVTIPLLSIVVIMLLAGHQPAGSAQVDKTEAGTLLRPGDRVVFLGNTFAERLAMYGNFETLLSLRYPELKLTFRNMAWSGDTPTLQPRPLNFGVLDRHLRNQQPDVIFLCFGMNESFEGEAGLPKFRADIAGFIDTLQGQLYNGKSPPRLALVSPIAHEDVGGDYPDPHPHNQHLALYTSTMREVAKEKGILFIDVFSPTSKAMASTPQGHAPLTINGIHLNRLGDWYVAHHMYRALGLNNDGIVGHGVAVGGKPIQVSTRKMGPVMPHAEKVSAIVAASDLNSPVSAEGERQEVEGVPLEQIEAIQRTIVDRNQQFFYRWRALNGEYIYGRRKDWYGGYDFESEFKQFDQIIAKLEETTTQQVSSLGESVEVRVKAVKTP